MKRNTKRDVEGLVNTINKILAQTEDKKNRRFESDYAQGYGGWLFYYYDENGKRHTYTHARLNHSEAYNFLGGIMFSLDYKI